MKNMLWYSLSGPLQQSLSDLLQEHHTGRSFVKEHSLLISETAEMKWHFFSVAKLKHRRICIISYLVLFFTHFLVFDLKIHLAVVQKWRGLFTQLWSLPVTVIRKYWEVIWIDICRTRATSSPVQVPWCSDTLVRICPQNSVQEPCSVTLKITLDTF